MVLLDPTDRIRILKIDDEEEAEEWRTPFTGAFQTVFGLPPYNERLYPSEAEGIYQRYTRSRDNLTLLAVNDKHEVIAFGIAVPLRAKYDVARELNGLVPVDRTFYLAELGVLPEYRGRGLGKELVRRRLALIDSTRFTGVAMRLPVRQLDGPGQIYVRRGFREVGAYTEVSCMRTDGRVTTDRRVYLFANLATVDVGHTIDTANDEVRAQRQGSASSPSSSR